MEKGTKAGAEISTRAGEEDVFYEIDPNASFKDDDIRRLRVTDPANADTVFNPLFRRILNNIRALFRDKFNRSEFTKENILGKLAGGSGGGAGTGLDADTVDGKHASAFASTAVATQSANGLFSAADKRKLDGVQAGATNYVHPATHPVTMITGLGNAAKLNTGTTAGTVAAGNHSHAAATQSAAGFMSAADKKKVDTIPAKHVGKDVSSGTGFGCEIFGLYDTNNAEKLSPSTIGVNTFASCAIGPNNTLADNSYNLFAIGLGNNITKEYIGGSIFNSITIGRLNKCGNYSVIIGSENKGEGIIVGDNNNMEDLARTAWASGFMFGESNKHGVNGPCGMALGIDTIVDGYQTTMGQYNTAQPGSGSGGTEGQKLIIGNGTPQSRSNCFRVTSAGSVYARGSYNSQGADFAEYKEWLDGNPDNEDRRGYFVTFDGAMIRKATSKDNFILGVISANPVLIGNDPGEYWQGRFEKDIFGSVIFKEYDTPQERTVSLTGKKKHGDTYQWYVENPKYRNSEPYLSRDERPEWGIVGCLGELVVVDDGTCEPNGYCLPNDEGIGTKSDDPRGYRVMKRLDETHILVWLHGRIIL